MPLPSGVIAGLSGPRVNPMETVRVFHSGETLHHSKKGGIPMADQDLHPDLLRRIELVNESDYEGDPLTKGDHFLLILAGLIIPFILMVWGW